MQKDIVVLLVGSILAFISIIMLVIEKIKNTPKIGDMWEHTQPEQNPFKNRVKFTKIVLDKKDGWVEYKTPFENYKHTKISDFIKYSKRIGNINNIENEKYIANNKK